MILGYNETSFSGISFFVEIEINHFFASQDAIEMMEVTHSVSVSTDLTDVTLVSEDTYQKLD